ncbi:hypothetical protein B9Z55_013059 [Caenorhabditis nigoni]|uniref:Neurotransmitter-gated ion-channel transmembrane domain-containing protein n=1 Tax=Caenorhabditis nigoni TaxID=1611254 RepID=A0A2G5U023_9PELO|nr:hypothetical protein B9Z55_013059 [Caenorhabditis nigoni]
MFLYVWMLVSMTFIFCSLLELAIVGFMVRDETVAKKKNQQKKISGNPSREESPHGIISERRFMFPPGCTESSKSLNSCGTGCWTPERIDSISSVMFPLTFFVFNIIYWFYYIHRKEIIRENLINRIDG